MTLWAITATVTYYSFVAEGWQTTRQVPTFYLNENVQGIISEEHAKRIARAIVNPFDNPDITVSITAVKEES